jgi:serine/threonine protein kinase
MLTGAPPFYSSNRKEILRRVLNYPVPIPEYLSESARSLLKGLLVINPEKRLGAINDSDDIKSHFFFKGIDFSKIKEKQVQPPS